MKDWGSLKQDYHHKFKNHGEVFCEIIIVTQLKIKGDEPLFKCGYRDQPYNLNLEEMSSGKFRSVCGEYEEDSDQGLSYNTSK